MNMKNGLDWGKVIAPHTRPLNQMKFIFLAEFLLYFLSWGSCLWWLFDWQLSGQTLSTHALRSGINYHYHGNYQWEGSGLCGLRGPCLQLLNPCWHTHTHTPLPVPCVLCTAGSLLFLIQKYIEPHRHTLKGAFWIIILASQTVLEYFPLK